MDTSVPGLGESMTSLRSLDRIREYTKQLLVAVRLVVLTARRDQHLDVSSNEPW
jgi:hypothetical protein